MKPLQNLSVGGFIPRRDDSLDEGSLTEEASKTMPKEILIIKHVEIEGAGSIGEFFQNSAWHQKVVELGKGETLPADLSDFAAIISLGGPMNVYAEEKFPFLKIEEKLIKKAIEEEIPLLGICLGAQILAKACGAQVTRAAKKEQGWFEVALTEEGKQDTLFKGLPEGLMVFQWHEDTFGLPEGGVLLASSSGLNQAFRFGKSSYGLQFHPEVTVEMIASWIQEYSSQKESDSFANKIILEALRQKIIFEIQAQNLWLNFARIIASSREVIRN